MAAVELLLGITIALSVAAFVSAAASKLFEIRERRTRSDHEWHTVLQRTLRDHSGGRLPRLSQLANLALGATPTRYTQAGRLRT